MRWTRSLKRKATPYCTRFHHFRSVVHRWLKLPAALAGSPNGLLILGSLPLLTCPRAIAIARQRRLEAEFVTEDFYHSTLPTQHYDVAICAETIGNVPDQPLFMEKIASLLKPGGYLVITAQNKFVFDRRSDLETPKPGQIRKWLTGREFHRLIERDFRILKSTTVYPCGNRGIMCAVNSYKVNRALAMFFSDGAIARAKEALGFGASRVITAQLPDRMRGRRASQC